MTTISVDGVAIATVEDGEDGQDGAQGPQGETGAMITDTVSGSTPSIIAQANHRYVCGTVSSISITPCASGVCDVIFASGSTPAVLSLPSTVKLPAWFAAGTLEANTTYEINILDSVYGAVMAWT